MNGPTNDCSFFCAVSSPLSTGISNRSRKCAYEPSMPGIRKSKMLHSSLSRFSIGVPVRAKRCTAVTERTAFDTLVAAFLMYCASSSVMQ